MGSPTTKLVAEALAATAGLPFDHTSWLRLLSRLTLHGLRHPAFLIRGGAWVGRTLWRMRHGLIAGRGRVHRLSFFIHDFMDARHLEPDRVAACAFMVATADGPVSMCLHNAHRDSFIMQPIRLTTPRGPRLWDPLVGDIGPRRRIPPKGRSSAASQHH